MSRRSIIVGSLSKIKRDAVEEVFGDTDFAVLCFESQSGVSEQPTSREETNLGAFNRAEEAFRECNDVDFAIGIENGMWKDEMSNKFVDGACIVLLEIKDHKIVSTLTEWSDCIVIPDDYPHKGINGRWSSKNDPHLEITGRSRKEYLKDALHQLRLKCSQDSAALVKISM